MGANFQPRTIGKVGVKPALMQLACPPRRGLGITLWVCLGLSGPPSVQVRCWPPFFGNALVLRSSTAKLPAQRSLGIFSLYVMPKLYARRIVGVPVIGHQAAPRACGMARNWGCLWLYVAPPKNHCQCMHGGERRNGCGRHSGMG